MQEIVHHWVKICCLQFMLMWKWNAVDIGYLTESFLPFCTSDHTLYIHRLFIFHWYCVHHSLSCHRMLWSETWLMCCVSVRHWRHPVTEQSNCWN